ncbi:MAG: ATP-binding cassette domain-containing protein, partial [Caldilineaceae bacterium SB0670_bin_27]|nr:ATP-binding cassette domain-containing protein [Caldilineaceae bacterium SB0670_bin_27]
MRQATYHIEVSGLWKVFGSRPERALLQEHASKSRDEIQDELGLVVGLRDVSFSVPRGQTFVVMGLSGSGKSTLARCLIRLIEATEGQIQFDGQDICRYSAEDLRQFRRDKIAMVFQNYALLPH